jgi:signal transduction histidine kinase
LERHQGEIRALNEQLFKAQEAERMRIAGELHDGVLQQITSLSVVLGTIRREIRPNRKPRPRFAKSSRS